MLNRSRITMKADANLWLLYLNIGEIDSGTASACAGSMCVAGSLEGEARAHH
jgi:hypothetical protein